MSAVFPSSRWALVEVITDGRVARYGVAWLRRYRGALPVLAAAEAPEAAEVTLFAASGRVLSVHRHREAAAARAAVLNRDLAAERRAGQAA